MITISKLKKLIIHQVAYVIDQVENNRSADLPIWDIIAKMISEKFGEISALKVKEVFYKEVIPSLPHCNYGITNEATLNTIRKMTSNPMASTLPTTTLAAANPSHTIDQAVGEEQMEEILYEFEHYEQYEVIGHCEVVDDKDQFKVSSSTPPASLPEEISAEFVQHEIALEPHHTPEDPPALIDTIPEVDPPQCNLRPTPSLTFDDIEKKRVDTAIANECQKTPMSIRLARIVCADTIATEEINVLENLQIKAEGFDDSVIVISDSEDEEMSLQIEFASSLGKIPVSSESENMMLNVPDENDFAFCAKVTSTQITCESPPLFDLPKAPTRCNSSNKRMASVLDSSGNDYIEPSKKKKKLFVPPQAEIKKIVPFAQSIQEIMKDRESRRNKY